MTQARGVHEATRRVVDVPADAEAPPGASWSEALRAHWRKRLGEHAETAEIVSLLASSLAPSTAASYSDHIERFARWCARQPDQPSPLPASTATVVRWIVSDVVRGDRVRAKSLQPYLSALNRIHRDLELDEPALGHVVQQVRRAVALRQAGMGRATQRVYLPPPVVERVLLWALRQEDAELCASLRLCELFRAAVASVLTFVIFCRGHSGSALRPCDVRCSAAGVTVTLDQEKGKRVADVARTITFPPGAVPGLEELLAKWERVWALRDAFAERADCPSYFSLPHERAALRADQIDAWLGSILGHLGERAPAGETWSGHSLRKGAASGAGAIDVALFRICYMGGWSIRSAAVHDYIDATCPDTPAARRFFGWLSRR